MPRLVTEPYLLDPRPGGIRVAWFTEGGEGPHQAEVGGRRLAATTTVVRALRDDSGVRRTLDRHVVDVTGLGAGRTPYRVRSGSLTSDSYTLRGAPDGPVRLLLTSDHQLQPLVAANAEAVAATVGPESLDGILFAGDLVNVPDRASDWFDRPRAFFRVLSGRAASAVGGRVYRGAPLLPYAPLLPAVGNHEVMGRRPGRTTLDDLFTDPAPDAWDTDAYDALFAQPRWWSRRIGDVFVVSLFATRAWLPAAETYTASDGQFVFEPVGAGSRQHRWLARELWSPAARAARFRVAMFHHSPHGLGSHVEPPFTDPVRVGSRWEYPRERDQLLGDVEPLLAAAGVELVLTGHNHVWNRFRSDAGVHWLETSNVGWSYGTPLDRDPGGLPPAARPLTSTDVTAFTLLDSAGGVVRSYAFDTRTPDRPAAVFDEFELRAGPQWSVGDA